MNPKIGRSFGRLGLTLRKNVTTITTLGSVLGVLGTAVFSAKAAYKSVGAIETHKDSIEKLHANKDSFETKKEYNKEVALVYKSTAIEMVKYYWPAALSAGLTIAGIFATDAVHRKRYFTMAGMYSAMVTAYNKYRDRVTERFGEEIEKELYHNLKREEVVTVEKGKNGKEKTKVEVVTTSPESFDDPTFSVFLIKPGDKLWYYGRPETTYYRLLEAQKIFTQILRTRGYLFLNEVLRDLELPEIPEGQVIGWVYDETKPEGDNVVDFGLTKGSENLEFFLNGKNEFVYITMNHDGTIYDKFPSFDRIWKRDVARRV